ncbi:MAG: polysaccharide biosynthesis tyrosine autokinase [Bryobacteraceae bacterium]
MALLPRRAIRSLDPVDAGLRSPVPPTNRPAQNQLAHYWSAILDRKWLLLGILAACTGMGAAIGYLLPPVYRAKTSVELLGLNSNFLNLQSVDPTSRGTSGSADSYTETQLELLKRDVLVERAVRKLQLDQNDAFVNRKSWLPFGTKAVQTPEERFRTAVKLAQKSLKVQQLRQSNVVEISFESKDPAVAVSFVNALAAEAVDDATRSRQELTQNVGGWLAQHLLELRAKMEAAELGLQKYTARTGLLPSNDAPSSDEALLSRLQEQVARSQADRIRKESRDRVARQADPQSLPEVIDDPALKEYRVRLVDLKRQVAELSASLTPEHPKVLKVQAQVVELEAAVANERKNIRSRMANEYDAARRDENAAMEAYTVQAAKVGTLAQNSVHYITLKRELETTRGMYEDMVKRVNDSQLATVVRAAGIRVVDAATAAEQPDNSKKLFIAMAGFLAGLLVAGTMVFVLDQTSTTFRMPGYAGAFLNVAELGVIPASREVRRPTRSLSLEAPQRYNGVFPDSFRTAINSILFATEDRTGTRMFAISSPGPGEGKTTITANLGMVLAEIGHRVLVVDADLRQPSLHKAFGMENTNGLTDLLSADVNADAIRRAVKNIPAFTGLDLLMAGEPTIDSFALLHSRRTVELLDSLRGMYDVVLVDTAPLLLVPETRTLARLTDWCILVLRAGQTTEEAAFAARQGLMTDGIPLLGTILNDCKRWRRSYGY